MGADSPGRRPWRCINILGSHLKMRFEQKFGQKYAQKHVIFGKSCKIRAASGKFALSFIYQVALAKRQRCDLFILRVKLPSVTSKLTTQT